MVVGKRGKVIRLITKVSVAKCVSARWIFYPDDNLSSFYDTREMTRDCCERFAKQNPSFMLPCFCKSPINLASLLRHQARGKSPFPCMLLIFLQYTWLGEDVDLDVMLALKIGVVFGQLWVHGRIRVVKRCIKSPFYLMSISNHIFI